MPRKPQAKPTRQYEIRQKPKPHYEDTEELEGTDEEETKPKKRGRKPKQQEKKPQPKRQKKTTTKSKSEEEEPEILERGHIYFFYKPKVDKDTIESFNEVQRLFLVLAPSQQVKGDKVIHESKKKRLIIIPKKKLPAIDVHARHWGIIEKVTSDLKVIDDALNPKEYETKTRGEQHVGGARPAGEGVYAIVYHHGHTHLAYVLELPDAEHMGKVQKSFNILKEGSFVITIKNPKRKQTFGPHYKSSQEGPDFPEDLLSKFQNYAFIPANPISLLDYPGAELVLIGAKKSLPEEFGAVGELLEELEKNDVKKLSSDSVFKQLHLKKQEHPPEPLIQGTWK